MNRERLEAPIDPVRRLPERATPGDALGCEGYVPMQDGFGKGRGRSFIDFVTTGSGVIPGNRLIGRGVAGWEQKRGAYRTQTT
jgi:hypothetical protein